MDNNAERPLIAVTGPSRGGLTPRLLVQLGVWLAGGSVVQLSPAKRVSSKKYQGVVITGGHDVDPVLYAAEPEVEPRYDAERDDFESRIINDALERDLPLLGICRGAQLLNVCLGGSLYQELASQRNHTSNRWTVLPLKTLIVKPDSNLCSILEATRMRINSLHNQGISVLGKGLSVVGRDLDGIIQAVENPGCNFLLGVQWHPEFLLHSARQRRLFAELVKAAQRYT